MAISTYQVYLMYKEEAEGTYSKLVDVKDFPDLGGAPEQLDTTTLSDKMKTSILGIQELDTLEFTANYTKADYTKLKALERKDVSFAVWMGGDSAGKPDGHDGKYAFNGMLSVFVAGGGVNEVIDMTISIAASTPIEPDDAGV